MAQGNKLFVGSLPYGVDDAQLEQIFSEVGQVVSAKVIKDKELDRSKGFGFVEMGSKEEMNTAIEKLNGATVDGRQIMVSEARPQERRPGGGFGSGPRSGGGYSGGGRSSGNRDGGSRGGW